MSMYNGKKKFDRKQLVFIVDVILSAAVDRIDSVLPDSISHEEYKENEREIESWINSAIEIAGMGMAILYAQLTGDGLGIGDALDIIQFDIVIRDFKAHRTNSEYSKDGPNYYYPRNITTLAETFVDCVFKSYL